MEILFRHAWILFLLVNGANAGIWWVKGTPARRRDPGLEQSYRTLIANFVLWGSLPWLAMGAGILFGGVPSLLHYFNLRTGGAFVWAFHATLVLVWGAGSYWIYRRGGADTLIRHPGLVDVPGQNATIVRLVWAAGIVSGLIFFAVALSGLFDPDAFFAAAGS